MNRLRRARERAGLSKVALAEAAGITRQTLLNLEKGLYEPKLETAQALARALMVEVSDLWPPKGE